MPGDCGLFSWKLETNKKNPQRSMQQRMPLFHEFQHHVEKKQQKGKKPTYKETQSGLQVEKH